MANLANLLQTYPKKPRVFILSDISNEPDDAESLVRYLLYTNQFDTQGIVAVTSIWLQDRTCPEDMHVIINAYEKVVDNLNMHTHLDSPYPPPDQLRSLVRSGSSKYGMAAVEDVTTLSDGAKLLKDRLEASQSLDEPLWVLCWGGTNVLAEVLHKVRDEHDAATAAQLFSKLRVYAISDQDDSSAWIRAEFPGIFYISSIHAWNQYGLATWAGISGEGHYGFDEGGPDGSKISNQWAKDNIQIGPLGTAYPDPEFVFEGDTPTFLYLVQNGLGSRENPNYGSWGGRYSKTDPSDRVRHFGDTADRVKGMDGRMYKSNQATIWRWRDQYQSDFAARIQWSIEKDFARVNHHPVISVNGHPGTEPLELEAEAGSLLEFDASATYDPDGDDLTFTWFQYQEPSIEVWSAHKYAAKLAVKPLSQDGSIVRVQIPPAHECCVEFKTRKPVARGQSLHLILEVTDSGTPQLTTYKRIIIHTTNGNSALI